MFRKLSFREICIVSELSERDEPLSHRILYIQVFLGCSFSFAEKLVNA